MSRNRLNLVVDLLAYLAMAGLIATGIILHFRLPPHSRSDAMLGLTRHEWGSIHFYTALSLLVLMVLHIVLHWKWVTHTFAALFGGERAAKPGAGLGGATLLIVLGLVVATLISAPWAVPVREGGAASASEHGRAADGSPTPPASMPHGEQAEGGQDIRGKSTIADAAAAAGVPVGRFLAELKLPPGTSPTESLGRLRQEHGFTLADVRELVARLKAEAKPEK